MTSKTFEVSASDGSGSYIVVYGLNQYNQGSGHNNELDWSCTCQSWKMRHKKHGGYCKHIQSIIERENAMPNDNNNARPEIFYPVLGGDWTLLRLAMMQIATYGKHIDAIDRSLTIMRNIMKPINPYILPDIPMVKYEGHDVIENYGDIVIKGVYKRETTHRSSGALSPGEYTTWLYYQRIRDSDTEELCNDLGIDPNGNFLLSDAWANPEICCKTCDQPMTLLYNIHKEGNAYVCTNKDCLDSVNYRQMPKPQPIIEENSISEPEETPRYEENIDEPPYHADEEDYMPPSPPSIPQQSQRRSPPPPPLNRKQTQ